MEYPTNTAQVTLNYPIELGGKTIEVLTLRRPKVRDQLIADKQNKNDADKEVHLMSLLANVETGVIQELDMEDYSEVQKVIVGFRKNASANMTSNVD
ncbi:phage tail assembly protein [Vibrio ostreicida]|uniref:Phage tail assembly protein n=1 Tax=Vibrio ostreicida TaxID=526588 RepID=A0ABT8BW43_9VIBR|nr:phage tail assembly protein [Vibrio ostreicida]MDN3611355.1 phage tail assembly protein [Vibrio ostreicida]NPD09291.1 phage tail assembly protein [Vibrio ostreicida]